MANKLLRFFEYDKVDFKNTYQVSGMEVAFEFTEKYQHALYSFHTLSKGIYYSLVHHGIKFTEHVGAIQILDLTIEVLPKIDKEDADKEKWHGVLIDMLQTCKVIVPKSHQNANLNIKRNSVLEMYFEKYISEIELILHAGLVKKYRSREANVHVLKGSILFNKQIKHNLIHAERFYTRHVVYTKNHLLHQILRQALEIIHQVTHKVRLKEKISCLLADWPEGKLLVVSIDLFDRVVLNRKTEGYKSALSIARLILLNYHPDISGGRNQVIALMFNMNNLWEEFIYQRLKFAGVKFGWEVRSQKRLFYWKGDLSKKQLIPDILIKSVESEKQIIIDTKWKRPKGLIPDDNDLRQILAYKLYFHADHAFLLYPGNEWRKITGNFYDQGLDSSRLVFRDNSSLNGGMLFTCILNKDKLQRKDSFLESQLVEYLKESLG